MGYYQKGEGFIAVYDVCNRRSFAEVVEMREEVLRERSEEQVPMVLMGNKCDLELERRVSTHEGQSTADSWFGVGHVCSIPFFESSAKDRINITEAFHEIVRQIVKANKDGAPAAGPASGDVSVASGD